MFSLICVWINGWVNTREAGDLRRYRGHYDVIIMWVNTGITIRCSAVRQVSLLVQNGQCTLHSRHITLQWRHNGHDSVSNHQPHGCLLNRLFRRRSKKTSKLCVTGLCVGNSPGPANSPHKGPVTRKMFPFDDVIMINRPWWQDYGGWWREVKIWFDFRSQV